LLVGKSKKDKYTVASSLDGTGNFLDDYTVLATPNEIRRMTDSGFKVDPKEGAGSFVEEGHKQLDLHYVVLLNNQYGPDHAQEIDPSDVPAEATFNDLFHPSLMERYAQRVPIPFEVPVFEVGSDGKPREIKRTIENLVQGGSNGTSSGVGPRIKRFIPFL